MEKKIFCENHRCQISAEGCLARQARAEEGLFGGAKTTHLFFPGQCKTHKRCIPYDENCLDCEQGKAVAGEAKVSRPKNATPGPKPLAAPDGFKVCRKCGGTKRREEFCVNARLKDGRHSYCKTCHNSHARAVIARKKEAAHGA